MSNESQSDDLESAPQNAVGISRDVLARGDVMSLARQRDGAATTVLSDEELLASRRVIIPDDYQGADIWVFGYGSLIWNPVVQYTQARDALVHGFHRRFCMWTKIGRGSPDCPGLVLALDNGGSTKGVIFRIPAKIAVQELDILWRREMMADSYRPVWLTAKTDKGTVKALSFAIRRNRPVFAPRMDDAKIAEIIYQAKGFVGPCKEYLLNTQKALLAAGIYDKQMARLTHLVEQKEKEARDGA